MVYLKILKGVESMDGIKNCITLAEQVALEFEKQLAFEEEYNKSKFLYTNTLAGLQADLKRLCEESDVMAISKTDDGYKIQVSLEKLEALLGYEPTTNSINEGTDISFKHHYHEIDNISLVAVETIFNIEHKKTQAI